MLPHRVAPGIVPAMDTNTDATTWDCIVVGGGAAGSSAALVLGRARRRTLVVDAGHPSNAVAEGIGGLLGHDGRPPADLYAAGRAELAAYPSVEVRTGEVAAGERVDGAFVLTLADGRAETTRRVLLATGMDYRHPELPGIAERWGRSVFHCPFCHGWEVRDRPLGVLDRGPTGTHRALLLSMWSDDVTLFADGPADLDPADADRLRRAGVAVEERPVTGLRGPGTALHAVELDGGSERPCGGLLVPVTLHQRSPLAASLGVELVPPGPLAADAIAVEGMGATSVPGVFAAGDAGAVMPSVANAVAAGSSAAAGVVQSLVAEAHGLAGPVPAAATR
jgi:thioredoxin reductase